MTDLPGLVAIADIDAVTRWLLDATPEQRRDGRRWYAKGRRETAELYAWGGPHRPYNEPFRVDLGWIQGLLAIGLAAPAAAARWMPWDDLGFRNGPHLPAALEVAISRGEDWCRSFVSATALQPPYHTFGLLVPLIDHFGLPVPEGDNFTASWYGTYDGMTVEDALRRASGDRLMPEAFHRLLNFAELRHDDRFPELAAALVAAGRVDRDRLIAQVFDLLTAQRTAFEQRALTKVLKCLDIRDQDVPPGVSYLQEGIATCHGSVGTLFLPYLIDRMTSEADVVELCCTVAGRTERRQRHDLVRALGSESVQGRIGKVAAQAGLEVFVSLCSDDAAIMAMVRHHLARLGRPSDVTDTEPLPTGLWDSQPQVVASPGRRGEAYVGYRHLDFSDVIASPLPPEISDYVYLVLGLSSEWSDAREDTAQALLAIIGQGRFDRTVFTEMLIYELQAEYQTPKRFLESCELVMQGGGLSSLWGPLLSLAAAATNWRPRPALLPRLLNLLNRYLHEVPDPLLPDELHQLAGSRGNSRSRHEARALVAATLPASHTLLPRLDREGGR